MAIVNKRLGAAYLGGATYTSIYTPSGTKGVARGISIANLTAVAKTLRLSNPSNGENATNTARYILYDYVLAGNSTIDLKYMITMSASDSLQLYTNATGVSAIVWGAEMTGVGEDIGLLGGVSPVVNRNTALYTVGTGKKTNISTINVCNRSAAPITYRIAHVNANSTTIASEDYIAYDHTITANDSVAYGLPISMSVSDTIVVRTASPVLTFMCWGSEIY